MLKPRDKQSHDIADDLTVGATGTRSLLRAEAVVEHDDVTRADAVENALHDVLRSHSAPPVTHGDGPEHYCESFVDRGVGGAIREEAERWPEEAQGWARIAHTRSIESRLYRPRSVAELAADGDIDPSDLETVAAEISDLCLVGWDTSGEEWEP